MLKFSICYYRFTSIITISLASSLTSTDLVGIHKNQRGWGKGEVKTCLKLYNDQIDLSFIWAISSFKFYGIMDIEGTNTSQSLSKLLKKVWESRRQTTFA